MDLCFDLTQILRLLLAHHGRERNAADGLSPRCHTLMNRVAKVEGWPDSNIRKPTAEVPNRLPAVLGLRSICRLASIFHGSAAVGEPGLKLTFFNNALDTYAAKQGEALALSTNRLNLPDR